MGAIILNESQIRVVSNRKFIELFNYISILYVIKDFKLKSEVVPVKNCEVIYNLYSLCLLNWLEKRVGLSIEEVYLARNNFFYVNLKIYIRIAYGLLWL